MLGARQAKLEYKRNVESNTSEVSSIHKEASLSKEEVEAALRAKEAYAAVFKRESAL